MGRNVRLLNDTKFERQPTKALDQLSILKIEPEEVGAKIPVAPPLRRRRYSLRGGRDNERSIALLLGATTKAESELQQQGAILRQR